MIRSNVHLTAPQHKALHALAAKTGLQVAELIRRAIDAYLKRESK